MLLYEAQVVLLLLLYDPKPPFSLLYEGLGPLDWDYTVALNTT